MEFIDLEFSGTAEDRGYKEKERFDCGRLSIAAFAPSFTSQASSLPWPKDPVIPARRKEPSLLCRA